MTTPEILPMLAGKADLKKQKFPVAFPPKLDGIRCLVLDNIPMSRKLKVIPNKHVQKLLSDKRLEKFDGELMVGDHLSPDVYRNTTSSVMSHDKVFDFTFWVFDIVNTDPTVPWLKRYEELQERVFELEDDFPISIVDHPICETLDEIHVLEEEYLDLGYEGGMLRALDGPYKMGRSTTIEGYLTKLKRFEDSEAVIIGFEELMHNGNVAKKNALGRTERSSHKDNMVGLNTLGKLLVRDMYTGVEFSIGTGIGLTAILRKLIWEAKEEYLGAIVKYRYFDGGSKDKPRFPVYHGFRDILDL